MVKNENYKFMLVVAVVIGLWSWVAEWSEISKIVAAGVLAVCFLVAEIEAHFRYWSERVGKLEEEVRALRGGRSSDKIL